MSYFWNKPQYDEEPKHAECDSNEGVSTFYVGSKAFCRDCKEYFVPDEDSGDSKPQRDNVEKRNRWF